MNTSYMLARCEGQLRRVTATEVQAAFAAGRCVYIHGRRDHGTSTMLSLDGPIEDTRGQCASVWEEQWSRPVESLERAYLAAGVADGR